MSRPADDWWLSAAVDSVSDAESRDSRFTTAKIVVKAGSGVSLTSRISAATGLAAATVGQRIIPPPLPRPGITLNRGKIQQTFRLKPTTEQ